MPLILPDNEQDDFKIVGKDPAGLLGAQLAAGQTISVVSADPATVVIVLDASPVATVASDDPTGAIPAGTPTIASGTVKSAIPPAAPNKPINVTTTILNADGSVFATIVDTATIAPGTVASVGELFGVAVPITVAKKK